MTETTTSKVSIVGAGGVGSSLAYAALIRRTAHTIALYDVQKQRVEAETADILHGASFAGSSRVVGSDDISVLAGSDIVVVTAGAGQRPGQTRLDLAGTNARIVEELMPALVEQAPNAVYIIVTNPCDVLTVVAQRVSGLPRERVFSSGTVLDSSRLRTDLAERVQISTSSIHAHVVGEHGDTAFPLWSTATVGGLPFCANDGSNWLDEEEMAAVADDVRNAAYQVIQGKGSTHYAIGLAASRIAEAVLNDERSVLPVGTVLEDYLGVDGIALSVPCVVGADGAKPLRGIPFSPRERELLHVSAAALGSSLAQLGY